MDSGTLFQIAEPIGQETALNAVEAEVKPSIVLWRRRKGIRSRVDLAVRLRLLNRDELPRSERKALATFNGELKVLGLIRQIDRAQ